MSTEKTPYEIRLEMIRLSKEFLENQAYLAKDLAMANWDAARQQMEGLKDYSNLPKLEFPKFPTFDDVMKMAEQMNAFVSLAPKKKD